MLANYSPALSATIPKLPLTLVAPLSSDLGKRGRRAEIYNHIPMAAAIYSAASYGLNLRLQSDNVFRGRAAIAPSTKEACDLVSIYVLRWPTPIALPFAREL